MDDVAGNAHLTEAGALQVSRQLFPGTARMALFDGVTQVSDWQPYVWNDTTGIEVADPAAVTHIAVQGVEGTVCEFAPRGGLLAGDRLGPPPQPWIS